MQPRETQRRIPTPLATLSRAAGSLIGLGLFAYLAVRAASWSRELYVAYQPGNDAAALRAAQGVVLEGVLWVLPFGFYTVVLLFVSRFGSGSYLTNLARGLRVSTFTWLSQIVVLFGLSVVDFEVIYRLPAILLFWSVCALGHGLMGRRHKNDESTRILRFMGWIVLLWSLVGYLGVLAS